MVILLPPKLFPKTPLAALSQLNVTLTSTTKNPARVAIVMALTSRVGIFAEKKAVPWPARSSRLVRISAGGVTPPLPRPFPLDIPKAVDRPPSFFTRQARHYIE